MLAEEPGAVWVWNLPVEIPVLVLCDWDPVPFLKVVDEHWFLYVRHPLHLTGHGASLWGGAGKTHTPGDEQGWTGTPMQGEREETHVLPTWKSMSVKPPVMSLG